MGQRSRPSLTTERLTLRWFTEDDAELMLAVWNDPGFVRHVADRGIRGASLEHRRRDDLHRVGGDGRGGRPRRGVGVADGRAVAAPGRGPGLGGASRSSIARPTAGCGGRAGREGRAQSRGAHLRASPRAHLYPISRPSPLLINRSRLRRAMPLRDRPMRRRSRRAMRVPAEGLPRPNRVQSRSRRALLGRTASRGSRDEVPREKTSEILPDRRHPRFERLGTTFV